MDSLPNWAWWTIVGGILLSSVFAFLLAVATEILIGVLIQASVPGLIIIALSIACGCLLLRKYRTRPPAGNLLGDQA
jgi:hypothetical protein